MSLQTDIVQFTGTEQWYQHWTKRLTYTDGVKFIAKKYGAYWLIDLVASYQPLKEDFQIWELKLNKTGDGAVVTCKADSDQPAIIKQKIQYTDFPEYLKLYFENGVLCLPSER